MRPLRFLPALGITLTLGSAATAAPSAAAVSIARTTTPTAFPAASWGRLAASHPGWSESGLADVKKYADQIGSTSVMIVQHGVIVDDWGDTAKRTPLYSARKSFLSALIGIAAGQHKINLDSSLAGLGIDDNPPSLTGVEKQATVRQLLEARSGVYHPTVYETPWMKSIKPARGSHLPGSFWVYNNWDFNALGAIFERSTGQTIFNGLRDEIAIPIGMQDYRPRDGHYVSGEPGSRFPAYLIKMSARDLARFGLLFLNRGRWQDHQVVPEGWVTESTQPYSDTAAGGYGYMWWTSDAASVPQNGQSNSPARGARFFWADGHLGQYAVVVPALDLVVVNRVDPKISKRKVSQRKMKKLLALIEAAEIP